MEEENKKGRKLENLFAKIRSSNSETKSTYAYLIMLIIIIIAGVSIKLGSRSENKVNDRVQTQEQVSTIDYSSELSNFSNNYETGIVINKYYINEYIDVKKSGDNKLLTIKTQNLSGEYNSNDTKLKEILKDKDLTFTTPENIAKLLDNKTHSEENKYMIEANKCIEVYNQINNTQIQKTISGEVSVEILSSENDELLLSVDLTNLYKNLDYDYDQVIYKIKFYNKNGVSLTVEESSSEDSTSGLLSRIYEELKKEEGKEKNNN